MDALLHKKDDARAMAQRRQFDKVRDIKMDFLAALML
jgi:hypothetical protein